MSGKVLRYLDQKVEVVQEVSLAKTIVLTACLDLVQIVFIQVR